MKALWLVGVLAATPVRANERAVFRFELAGAPAGWVELSLDGAGETFRYTSRHCFVRGRESEKTVELPTFGERRPLSLWLWRELQLGCAPVVEELGRRSGEACVTSAAGRTRAGRVLGQPFEAEVDATGALSRLTLGAARFVRERDPAWRVPKDPFGEGFPVTGAGGALGLEPAPPEGAPLRLAAQWREGAAEALAQEVREAQAPSASTQAPCLERARAFVARARARGASGQVVYGLVLDGGRAYPHAWVRVRRVDGALLDVDPTLPGSVSPRTHLALGAPAEGAQRYLELLEGKRRVVRR